MSKICYISEQNMESMNIVTDDRDKEILYVDKTNLHNANNDNVIKLINNGNIDTIDIICNIIAGDNKLNELETDMLRIIINNNGFIFNKNNIKKLSYLIGKSETTVNRVIDSLNKKRIIFHNIVDNKISLSSNLNLHKDKLNKIDFIIIEVNPNKTSNNNI